MQKHPNRRDAAVVTRTAKSGITTFSIKFRDADGRQVWERLGTDAEGWTRPKAKAELEARLVDVQREGLRRPAETTVKDLAEEWVAVYPQTKRLKRSTAQGYRSIVDNHLVPRLGHLRVDQLDVAAIERYAADLLKDGVAPATVNRHLNVVSLIVRAARKRGLLRSNPVELVDRPAEPRRRWTILGPAEIARVQTAFRELLDQEQDPTTRVWIEQALVVFTVVYGTGLRRGEVLGLRWRHVRLADPAGPTIRVEETFVRDRADTPKSDASERTIALGPVVADILFEHRARTAFAGEDDRVFCHPDTGGAMSAKDYAITFRAALVKAKILGPVRPFHDGRHGHLTNAAAAGVTPAALQARAGHADMSTTQRYIDLAGVRFREEAELAEARMFGVASSTDE
jgi:integrase